MTISLPTCPSPFPSEFESVLSEAATLWATHPGRPKVLRSVIAHWVNLIDHWANDETLPLMVRKRESGKARGEAVRHISGRILVPTDNSPAGWAFASALEQLTPSCDEIRSMLDTDQIPMAMIADSRHGDRVRYKCTTSGRVTLNALGWKICHKQRVALAGRGSLESRSIDEIKNHFKRFLDPENIFLVPLALGGLGELQHFVNRIAEADRDEI